MSTFIETAQGIFVVGAFVGAGCFAAGAYGRSIAQWLAKGGMRRNAPGEARALAMQTVLALDDFVGACYAAVHDIPEFNSADMEEFSFQVPDPTLVLPKDARWTLLDEELVEQVLWISNRERNLSHALDTIDLSAPAFGGFFERRQEGYARLAASAMDLNARLLSEFDLAMPAKPDYYNQAEGFAEILRRVETGRSATSRHAMKSGGEVTNVTHLFPPR